MMVSVLSAPHPTQIIPEGTIRPFEPDDAVIL